MRIKCYGISFSNTTTIASLLKTKRVLLVSFSIVTTLHHSCAFALRKAVNFTGFTLALPSTIEEKAFSL
jgi:hypothetical protein